MLRWFDNILHWTIAWKIYFHIVPWLVFLEEVFILILLILCREKCQHNYRNWKIDIAQDIPSRRAHYFHILEDHIIKNSKCCLTLRLGLKTSKNVSIRSAASKNVTFSVCNQNSLMHTFLLPSRSLRLVRFFSLCIISLDSCYPLNIRKLNSIMKFRKEQENISRIWWKFHLHSKECSWHIDIVPGWVRAFRERQRMKG